MVNKNSGLCSFCIDKVDVIEIFCCLFFLPILVIYSAFFACLFWGFIMPKLPGSGIDIMSHAVITSELQNSSGRLD